MGCLDKSDCFSNPLTQTDSGTFNPPSLKKKLLEKGILVGGEFCSKSGVTTAQPSVSQLLNELKTQRFTFLNNGVVSDAFL